MPGMTVYGEAPAAPASATEGGQPGDALGRLSGSARGWHAIQLAVLGFIGICGVLRTSDTAVPGAVQWLAAILAVAALAAACAAVFMVGGVAFPIDAARAAANPAAIGQASTRLRAGVRLTVVALILAVVAALSGWWPHTAGGGAGGTATVTVSDGSGRSWCGELVAGSPGAVSVNTSSGVIAVPVQTVAAIRPVSGCS
jgi:hypothetical protein